MPIPVSLTYNFGIDSDWFAWRKCGALFTIATAEQGGAYAVGATETASPAAWFIECSDTSPVCAYRQNKADSRSVFIP